MVDTSDPNKVEIEFAIRDSFSAGFQAMAREMVNANRKAQETTRGGGGFAELEKVVGSISKSLLGPLGVAGGLYAASRALDTFAVGQLQMKNFSRDTGFASEEITKMRQQLGTLGVPLAQADQMIGSFAGKMEEAAAVPWGTPMVQMLNDTNPLLASQVQHFASSGEKMKALDAIYKTFLNSNSAGQAAIMRATKMSRTEIIAHGQDVKDLLKPWKDLDVGAAEYHKSMMNLDQSFSNIWKQISQNAIKNIAAMTGGFEDMDKAAHSIAATINREVNKAFKDVAKILADLKEIKEKGLSQFLEKELEKDLPEWLKRLVPGRKGEGDRPEIPGKARPRMFSGDDVQSLADTEEDSNKVLHDMRDILDRMESGRPAPGGGGGGGFGGGLGDPMGRLPGMRRREDGAQASHDFPVDQSGKPVDTETVSGLRELAARGDTRGMQAFMQSKGYRVDSAWCGDLAKALVQGSGYATPKGYPVASQWRKWGEHAEPSDINIPGRTFGSMVLSKTNVPIGSTGGHVMTPVPGTYDPKTGTAVVVDTHGRVRRSVVGFEARYAGGEAEKLAQERQHGLGGGVPAVGSAVPGGKDTAGRMTWFNPRPYSYTDPSGKVWTDVGAQRLSEGPHASGLPITTPGIATAGRAGLGGYYEVTLPDGRKVITRKTDVGPPGVIDLNAALASQAYPKGPNTVPSGKPISARYLGRSLPEGVAPGFVEQSDKLTEALKKKTSDTRSISGTLNAEVDFKNAAFTKSTGDAPRFKPLKVTSAFTQNQKPGEGMLYPEDTAHTGWVP